MERLGETMEFGGFLLELLGHAGWSIAITAGFGGGVLVIARKDGLEVRRQGETSAAVASDLFVEAMRLRAPRSAAA